MDIFHSVGININCATPTMNTLLRTGFIIIVSQFKPTLKSVIVKENLKKKTLKLVTLG